MNHGYMYVIVRNDLTNAQKTVQSCHAAIESGRKFITHDDEHPSVITVVVKNELRLKKLAEDLKYDFVTFHEPDKNDEMTAIATRPLYGDERNYFKKYQLLI